MNRGQLRLGDGLPERRVLLFIHWAVEIGGIVAGVGLQPLASPRCPKDLRIINRAGVHNRRDGIVKIQIVAPGELADLRRERVRCQRAAGDDHLALRRNLRGFVADELNAWVRQKPLRHQLRERLAIHGQRLAGGNRCGIGTTHDNAIQLAHLVFEQAAGVGDMVAFKRVGADNLRRLIALVRRSQLLRPHLDQPHFGPALRRLPRRLAPRHPRPNYRNIKRHALSLPDHS